MNLINVPLKDYEEVIRKINEATKPVLLKCRKGEKGNLGPADIKDKLGDKLAMAGVITSLTNACLRAEELLHSMHGQNFALRGKVADLSSSALKKITEEMKGNHEKVMNEMEEVKKNFTDCAKSSLLTDKTFAEIVGDSKVALVKPMREAMKEVKKEDERTKNVIIRGLDIDFSVAPEMQEEKVKSNARDCLSKIRSVNDSEKSLDEVVIGMKMLGKIGTSGKAPPVLVNMVSSFEAEQVLKFTSRLSKVHLLRKVYVTPDMTLEEREKQKKLVEALKRKIEEFPEEHWVIRNGLITSKGKFSPPDIDSSDEGQDLEKSFQYKY